MWSLDCDCRIVYEPVGTEQPIDLTPVIYVNPECKKHKGPPIPCLWPEDLFVTL